MDYFFKTWSRHWLDSEGQWWYCSMVNITQNGVQEFWVREGSTASSSGEPKSTGETKDEDPEDKTDEANDELWKQSKPVKWHQDKRLRTR